MHRRARSELCAVPTGEPGPGVWGLSRAAAPSSHLAASHYAAWATATRQAARKTLPIAGTMARANMAVRPASAPWTPVRPKGMTTRPTSLSRIDGPVALSPLASSILPMDLIALSSAQLASTGRLSGPSVGWHRQLLRCAGVATIARTRRTLTWPWTSRAAAEIKPTPSRVSSRRAEGPHPGHALPTEVHDPVRTVARRGP